MAKFLRYMGEFLSRAGVVWRVEILQDADQPFNPIGSLDFEADEALVIEWGHAEKEEVICGSTATLRIESPGDRTYEDLYTIAPGRIRMDVYRENILYWSGALDPEFYEEPYEKAAHYPVSLTFSDFGILDRLKYDMSGMRSLYEIVDYCISRTVINSILDETLISTSLTAGGAIMGLADLKVRSDNFYDEDGEAATLKEVLEGILQPLALRIIQRSGKVYIYDLNALYKNGDTKEIIWDGDSQTLSTDKVYNNAIITWSPYAQSGNLSAEDCWTLDTSASETALNNVFGRQIGDADIFSYHYSDSKDDWADATDCGFTLWCSQEGKSATITDEHVRFYKIVPQYDGQESEGIALVWPGVRMSPITGIEVERHGIKNIVGSVAKIGASLFYIPGVWLPPVVENAERLLLCITMEMLLDPRFNPFEKAVDYPNFLQARLERTWNMYGNFIYVPVIIRFHPEGSTDVYRWTNLDIIKRDVNSTRMLSIQNTYGHWVKESDQMVWGYLAYYNGEDRAEKSGALGWQKNRPAINPHIGKLNSSLANAGTGQYIPYPDFGLSGGELSVEICRGWVFNDGGKNVQNDIISGFLVMEDEDYNWILCKLPEVEIMNNTQFDRTINTDDIEYKAEINADAKDDIKIDTICGSCVGGIPSARGAYFGASDGKQIIQLTRAGRTSQIEDLLIGTLFSQYGERHTTLSGEMKILTSGISSYVEANQGDKKFIFISDIQDVITDTSDATITELRPDEYDKKNRQYFVNYIKL